MKRLIIENVLNLNLLNSGIGFQITYGFILFFIIIASLICLVAVKNGLLKVVSLLTISFTLWELCILLGYLL